ncbi:MULTISPECIES: DNA-3-methyladenine glycosylase I [Corallincola]|uniref:DNA-3-methyladenine glycosylase I n=2 Tax=Corallincola TaxID=1775176 RepID=A0A368N5W4_9GAMM|nr:MULTISPECIES: DNA-3-methyladenine glycosylase I [Corallincola]RCU45530.1 DNA-3-methyladenine glycosylase I [Corallincola holothuriorum]TAA41089.1 DNA-3-methyladenine glycosylase I [Corallincola spongiicola]
MNDKKQRCPWPGTDPLYVDYHDNVWGRPVYDDRELFEKLCLDGQQAGLAWITILRKLDTYRQAYDQFEPTLIAQYDEAKVELLLQDKGIVRNRLKVNSIIRNAKAYLAYQQNHGSFSDFLWQFVGGEPIVNHWTEMSQVPATSVESDAMSKALKQAGFNFVGSTICYAFMQAVGMINDHLVGCHCYHQCAVPPKTP